MTQGPRNCAVATSTEKADTPRSFDQWRELANCHVMWRVTDDQAERSVLLDKIAAKCGELERKGQVASIWHATALITGRPCNCGQCAVKRAEGGA